MHIRICAYLHVCAYIFIYVEREREIYIYIELSISFHICLHAVCKRNFQMFDALPTGCTSILDAVGTPNGWWAPSIMMYGMGLEGTRVAYKPGDTQHGNQTSSLWFLLHSPAVEKPLIHGRCCDYRGFPNAGLDYRNAYQKTKSYYNIMQIMKSHWQGQPPAQPHQTSSNQKVSVQKVPFSRIQAKLKIHMLCLSLCLLICLVGFV